MPISPLDLLGFVLPKDRGSQCVARDVAFGADPRHKLDIYAPKKAMEPAPPVIVFFYGGSWSTGNKNAYAFAARALAALGYVVVVPDYRLLPEIEYPRFLEDCATALAWTGQNINRYGGDWTRLVLAGHSAGAYNAMMLALDEGLRQRHGQAAAIRAVIGLSGPYDFYPFDGPISLRVFGAVQDPERTQPVHHVRTDLPPMLLGTGDRDPLVLPRNSLRLAELVEDAGGSAEVRLYHRLAHAGPLLAMAWPFRWRAPVIKDIAAFLAELFAPVRTGR